MALAICASFVGMAHAKLEAASQSPSLLVVSCVRGSTNSIILSTNTIATVLDAAIGTSGTDSQLVGLVEMNITKQSGTLALKLTQLVQAPTTEPETNHFAALGSDNTSWTALEAFTNILPVDGSSRNSTLLPVTTSPTNFYTADILAAGATTYTGLIGVLSFYAVDDANNSTDAGAYTAIFNIGFST
ncbi:MAG: hypothetical protein SP4CHLAM5_11850 [Chlamydiia bacterium]|nr:hypothetical protein [Chlamydiia bacterium]MCH9624795.1 hypothetical protein [Chlamydiia bacterium]